MKHCARCGEEVISGAVICHECAEECTAQLRQEKQGQDSMYLTRRIILTVIDEIEKENQCLRQENEQLQQENEELCDTLNTFRGLVDKLLARLYSES